MPGMMSKKILPMKMRTKWIAQAPGISQREGGEWSEGIKG